jgi:hypothetical protein
MNGVDDRKAEKAKQHTRPERCSIFVRKYRLVAPPSSNPKARSTKEGPYGGSNWQSPPAFRDTVLKSSFQRFFSLVFFIPATLSF